MFGKVVRFVVSGGLLFVLDFSLLYLIKDIIGINYLVSSLISFIVSTIVNYIVSKKWVFKSKEDKFISFIILSIVALGINQLVMYLCVSIYGVYYLIAKVISTGVVMVFNFITRLFILK